MRIDQPVLDLSLARSRAGAVALTLCAAAWVVTFAAVFLLPVFMQEVQGHTALAAGLAMLPQGLITGLSTTLGQRVLRVVTVRTTVLAGFAVLTTASLGLLVITASTPLPLISALLAARSAAIGLVITPPLAAAHGAVTAPHVVGVLIAAIAALGLLAPRCCQRAGTWPSTPAEAAA